MSKITSQLNYILNLIFASATYMYCVLSRDDDLIVDIFATSPNMSTYLLCLIVCDFEYTEATTTKGVQVSWMSRSAMRLHIINENGCINMCYTC